MIEPKIDEVFEYKGKHYKCVEWKPCNDITGCDACDLPDEACLYYTCIASSRVDDTGVLFVEVKNEKD